MKPLLIRADASTAMGTGHVMRCLALAQAWQDAGGAVTFLMAEGTAAIAERLRKEGMDIERVEQEAGSAADAERASSVAREFGATWVVVDGYQFGAKYSRVLKEAGLKVLFVDDNGHAQHYCADLVLNQNVHASEDLYRNREAGTRLLLGPRYALLRREFNKWRGWKREIPEIARKVLVTMGGSDPDNVTGRVIEGLDGVDIDGLEVKVVVGGSNPNRSGIEQVAAKSRHLVRCLVNVDNMPELMAWADVAVAAAGTTTWETCFLALPSILLVTAGNQSQLARELGKRGAAIDLGEVLSLDNARIGTAVERLLQTPQRRADMSRGGQTLVDGCGTERVVSRIDAGALHLREARERDCKLLWDWANDPEVRASAFSSKPIPWEHHVDWFHKKLAEPRCRIFIAETDSGKPVGQVRFEEGADNNVEIDIAVAQEWRSKGVGRWMIDAASRKLFDAGKAEAIHAYVKTGNKASARAFELAGYTLSGVEPMKGHPSLHYVRKNAGDARG